MKSGKVRGSAGGMSVANTESAKKRLRQNEKRRLHNKTVKSEVKTLIKNCISAAEQKDKEKAEELTRLLFSKIDKAAKRGILHPNNAARKKSRVQKRVHALL